MQFSAWFHEQDKPQREIAARLGVTQGRIAQLLAGELPSLGLAFKIKALTSGKVTPDDWAGAWRRSKDQGNG